MVNPWLFAGHSKIANYVKSGSSSMVLQHFVKALTIEKVSDLKHSSHNYLRAELD